MDARAVAAMPEVAGFVDSRIGGAQSGDVSVESFGYDEGAWLTPAGFDQLFRGAHYALKFHLALVTLRPGADPGAALTATAAKIGRST